MPYIRIPLLVVIALGLSLWLEHSSVAHTHSKVRKPNAEATATPAGPIGLKSLVEANPYEKIEKLLAVKPSDISWSEVKAAMLELNISIPPVSSSLSSRMWDISGAPAADKRLSWVKSTDWVIAVNRYIAESHSDGESVYLKVNKGLRQGTPLTADEQKFMETLKASLAKLPAVQGFTFRGSVIDEESVKATYIAGKTIKENGFISSSINPATAYNFAFPKEQGFFRSKLEDLPAGKVRVIFIIEGRTGRPVSYFSDYWAEAETLFTTGTEFNVKAISPRFEDHSIYIVLEEK